MDVFEAIRQRRSIRQYQARPVEAEKIEKILECARLAPSASNRQEWRFVVVEDAGLRQRMVTAAAGQAFVGEAPAVIACCALESDHIMRCGHPSYAIDLAIAIDHMTLAAVALDLGTCWVGAFYEDQVREILGIPRQVRVVELLTLGYPSQMPAPRSRKKLADIMCRNRWT